MSAAGVFYDWVKAEELDEAHKIEIRGDYAFVRLPCPHQLIGILQDFRQTKPRASMHSSINIHPITPHLPISQLCRSRQSQAPNLFLGAYLPERILIGYVCSTLSSALSLTHESMSHHEANSSSVCIHSVCVSPDHRRNQVGVQLLQEYISRLGSANRDDGSKAYERALLITHEKLRNFYESAGFEWLGKSDVMHGSQPWFEMRKILGQTPDSEPFMPLGLWDALQRPVRNRPTPRSLASFGSIEEVCTLGPDNSNKYDLLCPRGECASIILNAGVAKLVERPSVKANDVTIFLF